MNRGRLRAGEIGGAVVAGGLVAAGVTFAGTVMACEWLKDRDGRDSPAAFGVMLLSTCSVPLSALAGGWFGWRVVPGPRRSSRLRAP